MRRLALGCTLIALITAACSSAPDQARPSRYEGGRSAFLTQLQRRSGKHHGPVDRPLPGGTQNAVLTRWLQIVDLLSPPSPYDPVAANSNTYAVVGYISTSIPTV
jgi:hypothetical protein